MGSNGIFTAALVVAPAVLLLVAARLQGGESPSNEAPRPDVAMVPATGTDASAPASAASGDAERANPGADDGEAIGGPFLGVVLARQSVDLAASQDGRIRSMDVRLGDTVTANQRIALLDVVGARSDLAMADAAAEGAEIERQKAEVDLAEAGERLSRRKALSAEALVSAEDLSAAGFQERAAKLRLRSLNAQLKERRAHAEQTREVLRATEVRAPFDGTIVARYVDPGASVTPATRIVRLISSQQLFVRFAVPAGAARAVRVGLPVRVRLDADGTVAIGRVEKVAPEVDTASRMIVVEATVDLHGVTGRQLPSGLIARVSLGEASR